MDIAPTGTNRLRIGGDFTLTLADSGALYQQIATAAGVLTFNGATGAVVLSTAGTNVFVSNSGTTIFVSGSGIAQSVDLTATGASLFARDSSISGAIDTRLQSTGFSLYVTLTGLSGQANTNYATVVNLALTGQQSWSAANSNGINTSGSLTQTGVQLANTAATTYATLTNVTQTGVSLAATAAATYATITNLALTGQSAWTAANANGINVSGRLTQTGALLLPTRSILNVTGNFTATGNVFNSLQYIWTGTSMWTGTLAAPVSLSGQQLSIKNGATGTSLYISGNVDNATNFVLTALSSLQLLSDNTTWNVI